MSRSNPQLKNPATRFLQWRGGEEGGGRITWYDKEAEEEKEIKLPFSFLVLDELSTITGFSKKDHSGFWSNEVRDLKNEELVVRTKAGIVARGTYANISEGIKAKGAKYAKSVYIAFKNEEGELVIGNIKMAGTAMSAWIDFQKKFNVLECAVFVTDDPKLGKNGTNKFYTPVFEGQEVGEATSKVADKLDEQLQQYLGTYLSRKPDTTDVADEDDNDSDIHNIEGVDTPAETPEIEDVEGKDGKTVPVTKPAPKEEGDKTINLKDVPF